MVAAGCQRYHQQGIRLPSERALAKSLAGVYGCTLDIQTMFSGVFTSAADNDGWQCAVHAPSAGVVCWLTADLWQHVGHAPWVQGLQQRVECS